jgi:hypothetical protein
VGETNRRKKKILRLYSYPRAVLLVPNHKQNATAIFIDIFFFFDFFTFDIIQVNRWTIMHFIKRYAHYVGIFQRTCPIVSYLPIKSQYINLIFIKTTFFSFIRH